MKQRISALDLQLLAEELKESLESYRLNNIYNIADSNRQFLLKFNKPDSKFSVVVDCGLRIHLTDYDRPTPPGPSGFVIKLRKHLKSKRLTALRQVHDDRILVLQFADGLNYLVLEFFSAGNVILLDENKKILALQRIVQEHENRVGEQYTMFDDSIFSTERKANVREPVTYNEETVKQWLYEAHTKFESESKVLNQSESEKKKDSQKKDGQKKKIKVMAIHRLLLSKEPHLSSDLLSKNLQMQGFNPSASCLAFVGQESKIIDLLNTTEREYQNLLADSDRSGYILAKRNVNFNSERDEKDLEFVYETFHPFEPFVESQNANDCKTVKIEGGYNKVLDDFFSTIESSKYALRIQQQEQQATKRLEAARLDNEKKIQALLDAQSFNEEKGHSIIANADLVEQTKFAVQGYVDQQMDWSTIEKLIQVEQKRGNRIAQLIQLPLNLKDNKITIRLPVGSEEDGDEGSGSDSDSGSESSSGEEEGFGSDQNSDSELSDFETEETIKDKPKTSKSKNQDEKGLKVTIDLGLSAYANASYYFNIKKSNAEKQKKVEKNVEKAFKNIEEKVDRQLKQKLKETHNVLRKVRTPYFFEKHYWFISSEGFLVLMGRSDFETDLIYSKYIEDDDIYLFNAFGTQVWIKNPDRTEVPPNTLMQAGILCMSASEAWSKKISSSPWWCFASNISKFEPTDNSVLPPGRFRLKSESDRNIMPPAQLVMGFGFLWRVRTEENANEDLEEIPAEEEDNEGEDEETEEHKEEVRERQNILEEPRKQENMEESQELEEPEEPEDSEVKSDQERQESGESGESGEPVSPEKTSIEYEIDKQLNDNASINTNLNGPATNRKVRGKKGKMKKMQRKYGDQDEEERRMRLEMLGTLKGAEKQQQKEQEGLERQQKRDFRKAKLKKQQESQALKFTKNEKVKVNYKKFHNELKPTLDRRDEILDVIPVCAPWPALLKYKYKVKIQPGSAKKTKTMHEILHHFTTRPMDTEVVDKEADWPHERETIKQLKEQDLILTLSMDKLKVTIAGSGNNGSKKDQPKKGKANKNKKK